MRFEETEGKDQQRRKEKSGEKNSTENKKFEELF